MVRTYDDHGRSPDTLVGEIGGSAGKINGIFANSADKENRVNTLGPVHHCAVLACQQYVTEPKQY